MLLQTGTPQYSSMSCMHRVTHAKKKLKQIEMSLKNKKKEKKIECEGRWRKAVKVGEQGYFGGRIIH